MRKLSTFVVLVALGCAAENPSPAPEPARRVVIATFTGTIDPSAGTFTIRTEATAAGRSLGVKALAVDSNVTVANGGATWNNQPGHCTAAGQSSGAPVTVKSNYTGTTRIDNVWAVIDTMTGTGMGACNADTALVGNPPLGFTATQLTNGVWYYGDLAAGATSTAREWAFNWVSATDTSNFTGHIEATVVRSHVGVAPSVLSGVSSAVMAGTADTAVFLDSVDALVHFVSSTGVPSQSGPLTSPPFGVAVNAGGTEAWVAEPDSARIGRVTIATGSVLEVPTSGAPWSESNPILIAVSPTDGVVWFHGGGDLVHWFNPSSPADSGSVLAGGVGASAGPMVAVNRGGTCYLYVEDQASGDIYRVNCTTRTDGAAIGPIPARCRYPTGMSRSIVAGGSGTAWYFGPTDGVKSYLCQVQDGSVFEQFGVDDFADPLDGPVYGADGNFWATRVDGATGALIEVMRLWSVSGPSYGARTSFTGAPGPNVAGIVSGAGSVWLPYFDGTAIQVTP